MQRNRIKREKEEDRNMRYAAGQAGERGCKD